MKYDNENSVTTIGDTTYLQFYFCPKLFHNLFANLFWSKFKKVFQ